MVTWRMSNLIVQMGQGGEGRSSPLCEELLMEYVQEQEETECAMMASAGTRDTATRTRGRGRPGRGDGGVGQTH